MTTFNVADEGVLALLRAAVRLGDFLSRKLPLEMLFLSDRCAAQCGGGMVQNCHGTAQHGNGNDNGTHTSCNGNRVRLRHAWQP